MARQASGALQRPVEWTKSRLYTLSRVYRPMAFEAEYDADLSWDDSSTGVYDSEDGVMMFMEHRRATLHETHEIVVDVHVTFDGLDPAEFEVDEVDLVEPSSGFGIRAPSNWEEE